MHDFSEHQEKISFLEKEIGEIYELISNKSFSQGDFIGSHPVTMTLESLKLISRERNDFMLCEKTDGVRFIMIILSNGQIYLTGR